MEWGLAAFGFASILFIVGAHRLATARLARIERKLNLLLQHSRVDLLEGLRLSERVKQLAADPARKIQAIKVYCEETGAGLAEAKEAVETFINSK